MRYQLRYIPFLKFVGAKVELFFVPTKLFRNFVPKLEEKRMDNASSLILTPPKRLCAEISLPASKSISGRALITYALTRPESLCRTALHAAIGNLSDCDDTEVMLAALADMPEVIDIKAAGTAMRFLTAYLSVTPGTHVITGTERMQHRPIGILVDALRQLGADVEYVKEEGFPPLRIMGKTLTGGTLSLPADVSSQYISALLMIGPMLSEGLTLNLIGNVASRPYIDMTLAVMAHFGAKAAWVSASSLHVEAGGYQAKPFFVECDWSAASYWYEMVALTQDTSPRVILPGLFKDSLQGDSLVKEFFHPLGVSTTFVQQENGVEAVVLSRAGKPCKHLELDLINQPDLAQTLIVCCAMLGTTFRFSGLASLKIKETNRTAALQAELRKLGIVVREDGNSIVYWDGERCEAEKKPVICTYEDHRMAMAFAPVCMTQGSIRINNPDVVSKSYPDFWKDFPCL